MTSKERHEARYHRRKAKRKAKISNASFDEVISFENLCAAGKQCCNGSRWKGSTINFETQMLSKCRLIYDNVHDGTRKFRGFHSFVTIEHGKLRNIDALPITERTLQKCLCTNILIPELSRGFIYDNSASLKNKGMDFAIRRLKKHLHDHYRKYGTEGGILQFDFKSYFKSLPHDIIKERIRKKIHDDRLYGLFCQLVDDFKLMSTADKDAERPHGVGLGSEVSQILALDFTSPVDHYIKDKLGIHGYGRYMDDGYVISESLDELKEIQKALCSLARDMGIEISEKKCKITPFKHHGFRFLKLRFRLHESGKVSIRLSRQSIRSIRRKLDIFKEWYDAGKMSLPDIKQSYQSWRAHAKRCSSHDTLRSMDKRFYSLFGVRIK